MSQFCCGMYERFLLKAIVLVQLSCEKYVVSTIAGKSWKLFSAEWGVSHSRTLVYNEKRKKTYREIHWSQSFSLQNIGFLFMHHKFLVILFTNVAVRPLLLVHDTDFKVLLILSPSGISTELFLDIVIDI